MDVPSDIDILNEINNFHTVNTTLSDTTTVSTSSNLTNTTLNMSNNSGNVGIAAGGGGGNESVMTTSVTSLSSEVIVKLNDSHSPSKKLNNPNEVVLTQETLRVFSQIHLDKFKTLPFNQQFDLLFNDVHFFKAAAVQGSLTNTNLRCISWMIFLECIPFNKNQWIEAINKNRNIFKRIKYELTVNPRDETNLNVDHPLAQETKSNWNQYFANNELKSMILQDVLRIHKPSSFFNETSTHNLIVELLFIYVKFTNREYRQGMHEILVCLMFVLHDEYTKLALYKDTNEHINTIADLDYLEHDSFTLFVEVMSSIYEWFNSKPILVSNNSDKHFQPKLFQPDEDIENVIISKINFITNSLLRNNDSELYFYFIKNNISLAPFGIRWLRLLFLRELEFPSCLILWDAMFAIDKTNFVLADFIFISLLMSLRELLIYADHSNCMKLLMQQDLRIDALNILKRALYLHNPETFSMPDSMMEDSFEYIHNLNNLDQRPPTTLATSSSMKQLRPQNEYNKSLKSQSQFYLNQDYIPNNSNLNFLNNKPNNSKLWDTELNLISFENLSHNKDLVTYQYINKISELQHENEVLKVKLNDLEDMCQMCSTKMNASICLLQEEILKLGISSSIDEEKLQNSCDTNNISTEDAILLALAGLKQVRDKLSFSLGDSDKALKIDETNRNLKAQDTSNKMNRFLKHFKFSNNNKNSSTNISVNLNENNKSKIEEKKSDNSLSEDLISSDYVDIEDNGINMKKIQLILDTESKLDNNTDNNNQN